MHWRLSHLHSSLAYVTNQADGRSAHHESRDLPQVFSPADAVHVLRGLGLTSMTECALRTRAYRKQVPFHLNGRRITFTLGDLQEIAEGKACRPQPRTLAAKRSAMPRSARHHHPTMRDGETKPDAWRARSTAAHQRLRRPPGRQTSGT
jgi:hypothetical protein